MHHIIGDMRLVLDTSVLVSAVRSPAGASAEIVRMGLRRELALLCSVSLAFEYEAVLMRPALLEMTGVDRKHIENALDALLGVVEPVEIAYQWRPILPDPNDDMVLEVAVNGRANAVVTFNLRDFAIVPAQFGVDVLEPASVMRRLRHAKA